MCFRIQILNYVLIISCFFSPFSYSSPSNGTAPVSEYARAFIYNYPIANATVTILESGEKIKTNDKGKFGPIDYPIGKPITLFFEKWGYKSTQSGTTIVPPKGLNDAYNQISFQIPTMDTFYLFTTLINAKFDKEKCHVVTTVLANGKTMDDDKQGEPEATLVLSPFINEKPFYFDIFKDGPLKDKTNPFTKELKHTSEDGGAAFFNLPVNDKPYILSARKNGIKFSEVQFMCRKDVFINVSPPNGPMVVK